MNEYNPLEIAGLSITELMSDENKLLNTCNKYPTWQIIKSDTLEAKAFWLQRQFSSICVC